MATVNFEALIMLVSILAFERDAVDLNEKSRSTCEQESRFLPQTSI